MHLLVGLDASQRRLAPGVQGHPGVAREVASFGQVEHAFGEQVVDVFGIHVEFDEPRPRRVGGQFVAVLVGVEADDAGLES